MCFKVKILVHFLCQDFDQVMCHLYLMYNIIYCFCLLIEPSKDNNLNLLTIKLISYIIILHYDNVIKRN